MSLLAAIEGRDAALLPSRRLEDWRWTDIRGLIRTLPEPSAPFKGTLEPGPFDGLTDQHVVVANGAPAPVIQAGPCANVTIALRFVSRQAGAHASRIQIKVAAGARLTLLESYEGDDGDYVAQASLDIDVEEGGALERIILAADGPQGVSVSQAMVTLAARAVFNQTVLTDGARRQRLETQVIHPGGGAAVRIDGVYVLGGQQHADLTTVVDHIAPDGTATQLTKGVVGNQARAVFQGKILVQEGADRTDARMGHHALVLSDKAEVDAKPELQIWADEVSCAHGNTVGALDDDALFYARQRGIPLDEARAMLTEAFVGEVVDRMGHAGAQVVARGWVANALAASVGASA